MHWPALISSTFLKGRDLGYLWLEVLVWNHLKYVRDAIQPCTGLIIKRHNIPGGLGAVRMKEHIIFTLTCPPKTLPVFKLETGTVLGG